MAKTANPAPKPEGNTGAPKPENNAANSPAQDVKTGSDNTPPPAIDPNLSNGPSPIENKLPEGEGVTGEKLDAGANEEIADVREILINNFQHEGFAAFVATLNEDERAKVRANFQKALEILGEGPKVENKAIITADDAEELDEDEDAKYLKRYGPGYVRAQHTDGTGRQTIFSAQGWKNLGEAKKDGSKDGWKVLVKTPPEVKKLAKNKNS